MMYILAVLPLVVGTPLASGQCSEKLQDEWPLDLGSTEISWRKNSFDNHQPLYRLSVEQNSELARPGERIVTLVAADQPIHRFLISAVPDEESACGAGTLHSRSAMSEPVSYSCPAILQEKQPTNITSVEFGWTAPDCGCVQINAKVLDGDYNIFTVQDDPHNGLRIQLCASNILIDTEATAIEESDTVDEAEYEEGDPPIQDADVEKATSIAEADLEENLVDDANDDVLDLIEDIEDEGLEQEPIQILPKKRFKLKRQKNKNSKVWKKHMSRVAGKRWCCRQGKAERRNKGRDICGQNVSKEVLDFGRFKFGIGKEVCENTFARCCSNGKLRLTALSKKMKKLRKTQKNNKWKKIMKRRQNKAKRNKNKENVIAV